MFLRHLSSQNPPTSYFWLSPAENEHLHTPSTFKPLFSHQPCTPCDVSQYVLFSCSMLGLCFHVHAIGCLNVISLRQACTVLANSVSCEVVTGFPYYSFLGTLHLSWKTKPILSWIAWRMIKQPPGRSFGYCQFGWARGSAIVSIRSDKHTQCATIDTVPQAPVSHSPWSAADPDKINPLPHITKINSQVKALQQPRLFLKDIAEANRTVALRCFFADRASGFEESPSVSHCPPTSVFPSM